jgi:hypothetical protein
VSKTLIHPSLNKLSDRAKMIYSTILLHLIRFNCQALHRQKAILFMKKELISQDLVFNLMTILQSRFVKVLESRREISSLNSSSKLWSLAKMLTQENPSCLRKFKQNN